MHFRFSFSPFLFTLGRSRTLSVVLYPLFETMYGFQAFLIPIFYGWSTCLKLWPLSPFICFRPSTSSKASRYSSLASCWQTSYFAFFLTKHRFQRFSFGFHPIGLGVVSKAVVGSFVLILCLAGDIEIFKVIPLVLFYLFRTKQSSKSLLFVLSFFGDKALVPSVSSSSLSIHLTPVPFVGHRPILFALNKAPDSGFTFYLS